MRFAHALLSQAGREVETLCGVRVKLRKDEPLASRVTGFPSRVTCKNCKRVQAVRTEETRTFTAEVLSRG